MDKRESSNTDNKETIEQLKKHHLLKQSLQYFEEKGNKDKIQVMIQFLKKAKDRDRNTLIKIAEKEFNEECLIVPKINEYNNRNEVKATHAIFTVGTRKAPIILSTLILNAKNVYLLHTEGSKETAEEIETYITKEMGKNEIKFMKYEVDEVNPHKLYKTIQSIVKTFNKPETELIGENIVIDPTGGRKSMSAGAAAAAFFYGIKMVYLHGYEQLGIIMPYTEQLKEIPNPYNIYGDINLKMVFRLMKTYNFTAATTLLEEIINEVTTDPMQRSALLLFKNIIIIYAKWDQFGHSKSDKLEIMSKDLNDIIYQLRKAHQKQEILTETTYEQIKRNIEFLKRLEKTWKKNRNIVDEYRIVDLFVLIERRKEIGKFSEALALIYRLFEMMAVYLLIKFTYIQETNPTMKMIEEKGWKVPDKNKEKQVSLSDMIGILKNNKDDQIKSKEWRDVVNRFIEKYNKLYQIKEGRNYSLFGHGTDTVSEEEFEKAWIHIQDLLQQMIPGFESLRSDAKFPSFQSPLFE